MKAELVLSGKLSSSNKKKKKLYKESDIIHLNVLTHQLLLLKNVFFKSVPVVLKRINVLKCNKIKINLHCIVKSPVIPEED